MPGGNWLLRERPWTFAFLALLTFCRIPTIDGWDEAFYVGQLTSLVGDGDLKLQDDVVRVPRRFEEEYRILTTVDGTGALVNTFGVGPALLLLLKAPSNRQWNADGKRFLQAAREYERPR